MRDSIYRLTLDIHRTSSQVQITAKKNDNARKLIVNLMENGKPYTIESGSRAVFMMTKPDETVIFNDCDISESTITYEFTEQTVSYAGLCECEIRLFSSDNTQITSPRFTMLIDTNVYDDGQVTSSSEFKTLTTLITETVDDWLDEHPEATTTVEDDSIDTVKFTPTLRDEHNTMKANISTLQSTEATLASRMDTFTKLAEGSTTGDAELADIRTGYDGTEYSTAGSAVRGQITDLHTIYDMIWDDIRAITRLVNKISTEGFTSETNLVASTNTVV